MSTPIEDAMYTAEWSLDRSTWKVLFNSSDPQRTEGVLFKARSQAKHACHHLRMRRWTSDDQVIHQLAPVPGAKPLPSAYAIEGRDGDTSPWVRIRVEHTEEDAVGMRDALVATGSRSSNLRILPLP